MLRLLKRSKKSAPPSAQSATVAQPEQRRASGGTPPATPAPEVPRQLESPAAASDSPPADLRDESTAQRRDSDEFFTTAIQEFGGDDFLLSPAKVTVDDINSIQEGSPTGRVWAHGSGGSIAGSSSPPESHHNQRQQAHSRSGSGAGVSRSLFSASEDDVSWLVAAPSANGSAADADFSMLDDSPPRRASGRAAVGPFAASPSRIPSGPGPSPSPSISANSGRSRIPKPAPDYTSPVKAGNGAGGSRIPASPTPSSTASRIPVSPSPSPSQDTEHPVPQYAETPSRLPSGPTATLQAAQGQLAVREPPPPPPVVQYSDSSDLQPPPPPPARHYSDSSDLQPAVQAAEPDVEPAPASPRADVPYSEPARQPSTSLPLPVAAHSYPAAAQQQQQQPQVQTQLQAPTQPHAADTGEWTGVAVGRKRPAIAEADSGPRVKQQPQAKPPLQNPQKDKQCCGCCIM